MARKTLAERTHGTTGTYAAGCACDPCREAWREYNRGPVAQLDKRARQYAAMRLRRRYRAEYDALVAEYKQRSGT